MQVFRQLFLITLIKFLHMSEKSSTFATEFERKGTIKTTPNSLTCVRDYREYRSKSTTFFELCKFLTKNHVQAVCNKINQVK